MTTKIPLKKIALLLNEAQQAEENDELGLAKNCYQQVLSLDPKNLPSLNSLGAIYYRASNYERASQLFKRATKVAPNKPRAWTNLGACYHDSGKPQRAITCYKKAIGDNPNYVNAYQNLGNTYDHIREHELALAARIEALALAPGPTNARVLAKSYRAVGRYDRALSLLERAAIKAPQNINIHFDLALILLGIEQWERGFDEYEWRFKRPEMGSLKSSLEPIFSGKAYKGENLSKSTLVLFTEQGFGDCILFARFVWKIRKHVGQIIIYCRPGLGRLFKRALPIDVVCESIDELPAFDFHLPLLSIPRAFPEVCSDIANPNGYLTHPKPPQKAMPKNNAPFTVGIVWSVSDSGYDYRDKKIPLSMLKPLLRIKGVTFISLQVGDDSLELKSAGVTQYFSKAKLKLNDFADTADIITQLDLVISVDTSVAHLTGALAKPVWVLLKKEPYWVWQPDGERSTWYPSARLYRQFSRGDWSDVIRRITKDLYNLVNQEN